jgi:hypothetical protein
MVSPPMISGYSYSMAYIVYYRIRMLGDQLAWSILSCIRKQMRQIQNRSIRGALLISRYGPWLRNA